MGIKHLLEEITQKSEFIDHPWMGRNRYDQERVGTPVDVVSKPDSLTGIYRDGGKDSQEPVQIVMEEKLANHMIFPIHPFQFDSLDIPIASSDESYDDFLILFGNLDNPVVLAPDNERMGWINFYCVGKLVG